MVSYLPLRIRIPNTDGEKSRARDVRCVVAFGDGVSHTRDNSGSVKLHAKEGDTGWRRTDQFTLSLKKNETNFFVVEDQGVTQSAK